MTSTLTETFGNNVAGRVEFFRGWFVERFGEKANARASSLETPQRDLNGQSMMGAVRASDTGMQTVMNMLTPSRGA